MKRRTTAHWENISELEGLLFFAQRLDELLFDYTLETYKFSALNTCFLCREALSIITYLEQEIIEPKHLEFVIEELNWSYTNDEIAKKLLSSLRNEYFPVKGIENLKNLKLELELISNKLSLSRYLNETKILLRDAIEKKEKKRIDYLTSTFVTTLINAGYHKNYIYAVFIKNFCNRFTKVATLDTLTTFFDIFNLKENEYKLVFKCSKLLTEIKDSCEPFHVEISETCDLTSSQGITFKEKKKENELYITCNEIKALDGITAKLKANKVINRLANLFTFFHHKEVPSWSKDAIAIKEGVEYYIKDPLSPMVKISDFKPWRAARLLNSVLSNLQLQQRSLRKFTRAIDLHSQAVAGKEIENQILDIWIAFETMIDGVEGGSKINQITNAIVPFITLMYLRGIFSDIFSSLLRWNRKCLDDLLNKVSDDIAKDEEGKIALITTGEEYEDLRKELYARLKDFPLLKFRIWQLSTSLKNAEKISEFIESHKMKVTWHIRRIYRARNLIVHEGTIPRNIDILAENAHTYLDKFLHGILVLAATEKNIKTINQGIKESSIIYKFWQDQLKSNRLVNCNSSNYKLFLFGE